MKQRKNRNRKYDGKVLFQAWCSWGNAASNPRLMEFAKANFGAGSQMGPRYAMWAWAFHNPEEAFEYWKEYWFDTNPDKPPAKFEDFLIVLRDQGQNKNVAGQRKLERFCAKYGIPMDFRVEVGDVVQITKKNHPLFQSLLVVEGIDDERIDAYYFSPDRVGYDTLERKRIECQVNIRELGVIGKAIV